jgi:DNA modification methylase
MSPFTPSSHRRPTGDGACGLRDYGTGAWDGGDPECDHEAVLDAAATAIVGTDGFSATNNAGRAAARVRAGRNGCPCGATRVDQQLGLEPTPEQYVAAMVDVFREVRRVLRKDGTCWVNLGDSYASGEVGRVDAPNKAPGLAATQGARADRRIKQQTGLKPKDLVGIPWRVAFALQSDGWYLRSDIIWAKPNPMPESVTDRPTKAHEYVFLLTRSPRYFFDQEAVREKYQDGPGLTGGAYSPPGQPPHGNAREPRGKALTSPRNDGNTWNENNGRGFFPTQTGRNIRSVWEIATQPYPEAHFATFPEALPDRCIRAGTSERGCCPVCGAPWERETEKPQPPAEMRKREGVKMDYHSRATGGGQKLQDWYDANPATTTGWRPSCDHELKPVPCVTLDPFMGSGTVAVVARRLGRRSIGIELNPEYAELSLRRLGNPDAEQRHALASDKPAQLNLLAGADA